MSRSSALTRIPLLPASMLGVTMLLLATLAFGPAHAARPDTVTNAGKASPKAAPAAEGVININQASAEQLEWLPGIGAKKAERIVSYRTRKPFKKVTHLARVKGIGLKTVRKLRGWLTVKGDTTLTGPVKKR